MKYDELNRKQKQLLASEYPYKANHQLWDRRKESNKFLDNQKELIDFKEKAAQDDVSLIKKRDFVTGREVARKGPTISIIDAVLGEMGEEPYRAAIEIARNEFDPLFVIKDLFAIQTTRLRKGIEYENDVGLGVNAETEACMSNLVNIIKVGNDIINGKKLDIKVDGSLSNLILDMDIDGIDDIIDDDDIDDEIIDTNKIDTGGK